MARSGRASAHGATAPFSGETPRHRKNQELHPEPPGAQSPRPGSWPRTRRLSALLNLPSINVSICSPWMMSENMGQDPGPRQEEKCTGAFSHTRHTTKMPTLMLTSESRSLTGQDRALKRNGHSGRTPPTALASLGAAPSQKQRAPGSKDPEERHAKRPRGKVCGTFTHQGASSENVLDTS